MSFTSHEFAILLAATFALYYLPWFARLQVPLLVAASLVFYAFDQYLLLPLLLVAVVITYAAMLRAIARDRVSAAAGIAGNLGLLAFFKYKLLFVTPGQAVYTGQPAVDFLIGLPLPIGISFFVFHNISLIADYYTHGRDRPRPSPLDVVLYIMFFPQLVSGPITRAIGFLPQIGTKQFRDIPWAQAIRFLILGFFFKLVVANNLAQATAWMNPEASSALGGGDRLLLLFAYSCQIYADFMGYSVIALGLALLFGYRLPVNFDLPYAARSFSDFWNRWHISLSSWLRTYLYLPLGGNRRGRARTYLNLMIVMGLGGLWHGAAVSYLVWGLAHGALLAIERFVRDNLPWATRERLAASRIAGFGYSLFVFVAVSFCWLLFRFEHFPHAAAYLQAMAADPLGFRMGTNAYLLIVSAAAPVLIQHVFARRVDIAARPVPAAFLYAAMLFLAITERGADTPFIYFRF